MTVSTLPPFIHNSAKRKYSHDDSNDCTYTSTSPSIHRDISPRLIKKARPKPISSQSLRCFSPLVTITEFPARTVSRLFEGQRNYQRRDVDVEMTVPNDANRCAFCESFVDEGLGEEERTCLQCTRTVCGKCGVRQYLSEGDYVACLECVQR